MALRLIGMFRFLLGVTTYLKSLITEGTGRVRDGLRIAPSLASIISAFSSTSRTIARCIEIIFMASHEAFSNRTLPVIILVSF